MSLCPKTSPKPSSKSYDTHKPSFRGVVCPQCTKRRKRLCRPVWEGAEGVCIKCALIPMISVIVNLHCWGVDLSRIPVFIRCGGGQYSSGRASVVNRKRIIRLRVGMMESDALATLIHEFAHHATDKRFKRGLDHGGKFQAVERAAYEEVLGDRLNIVEQDQKCQPPRYVQVAAFARSLEEQWARNTMQQYLSPPKK